MTAAGNLGMAGVTIRNGKVVGVSNNAAGAGIEVLGTLRLSDSVVSGNVVAVTGSGVSSPSGAGIAGDSSTASLTLSDVNVTGNEGSSTGVAFIGGGVGSDGTLTYRGGVVANNTASFQPNDGLGEGGGISITRGTATLASLDIHDNTAGGGGGVVDEDGPSSISNSTLRNNHAKSTNDDGGGWLANGVADTLTDVTIAANDSVRGGGGMTDHTDGSTLINDTIAGNTSAAPGGGLESGTLRGATKVTASILSGNAPGNCGVNQGRSHHLTGFEHRLGDQLWLRSRRGQGLDRPQPRAPAGQRRPRVHAGDHRDQCGVQRRHGGVPAAGD